LANYRPSGRPRAISARALY